MRRLALLLLLSCAPACRSGPPRLEAPVVGTRKTAKADLEAKTRAPQADIIGCDIEYKSLPAGSKLHITWRYWTDPSAKGAPDATQRAEDLEISGSGTSNAYFEAKTPPLPFGVYECRFDVTSEGPVEGRTQSARITLGR